MMPKSPMKFFWINFAALLVIDALIFVLTLRGSIPKGMWLDLTCLTFYWFSLNLLVGMWFYRLYRSK